MTYATVADLARLALDGWDELAQRASRDARLTGELLQLTYAGGDRAGYDQDDIDRADAALALLTDALERTSKRADAYLSPRYRQQMPLSAEQVASSSLPDAVAMLALLSLYGTAVSDEMRKSARWAEDYLADLASGKASLGIEDKATAQTPGRFHVSAPGKSVNWSGY